MPRLSKAQLRRRGQLSWYNQLVKAGRNEDAQLWAKKHKLFAVPVNDPAATLSGTAPVGADPASPAPAPSTPSSAPLPTRASIGNADTSLAMQLPGNAGGAGVSLARAGHNLDQSGQGVENPQSLISGGEAVAGPLAAVGSAADAACPASPSGEVEGKVGLCQANIRKTDGWDEEAEGVVGARCRNKWYVEVCMPKGWAKADVGDWLLQRGDRVRARLKWVSSDGRDAEYEVVQKVQQVVEPVQAAPVGLAGQGNVGVSHFQPVASKAVFQTVPPQSLGLQQLPVPVIHDQPKEVVFQTTTMEQVVARERVGVMHASGKTGPAPVREDFRSPVLDDVPAPRPDDGPSATDLIERMRQEAYEDAMRG